MPQLRCAGHNVSSGRDGTVPINVCNIRHYDSLVHLYGSNVVIDCPGFSVVNIEFI
jgi:hypothetical protein